MRNNFFHKIAVLGTAMIAALSLCFASACIDPDDSPEPTPPNDTVSLTFAMLSDIHLQPEDDTATRYFTKAVNLCNENAENGIDALVLAGDLTDATWYPTLYYEDGFVKQNNTTRQADITHMIDVFEEVIPQDTSLIYTLGNHDMATFLGKFGATENSSQKFYDMIAASPRGEEWLAGEDRTDYGFSSNQSVDRQKREGLRYVRLKNAHFITVDCNKYWKVEGGYTATQQTWLDEMLAHITATYPDEPVYVITHTPLQESVQGTAEGNNYVCKDLIPILAKYPQTVTFTGHIHNNNYTELAISSNTGSIAVECSSVKYTDNATYDANGNFNVTQGPNSYDSSQGLLVTVYEDGRTRIERFDFSMGRKSGPDWVIDAPGKANRVSDFNNQSRANKSQAPVFAQDAADKCLTVVSDNRLTVTFPSATDDERVWAYKVKAVRSGADSSQPIVSVPTGSAEQPETYTVSFQDADEITSVEIVAEDSFFKQSKAIVLTAPFTDTAPESKQPDEYVGNITTPQDVRYGDTVLRASEDFVNADGVLSNYRSSIAHNQAYFDALADGYEFSYRIANMRLCKAHTGNGRQREPYRLGANLATWMQNGKIYSLNMALDFGYAKYEDATDSDDRAHRSEVRYYLTVTYPNMQISTRTLEIDLPTYAQLAEDVKAKLRSAEGVVLSVLRDGSTFVIALDGTEIDRVDLAGTYVLTGDMCTFTADTVAAFGVATYGAEAYFSEFAFDFFHDPSN